MGALLVLQLVGCHHITRVRRPVKTRFSFVQVDRELTLTRIVHVRPCPTQALSRYSC